MAKLFVVGFPFETEEEDLAAMFRPFGEIGWVNIIRDKDTSKSLGYGFVMFPEEAAARKAHETMDCKPIGERILSVKIAISKQKRLKALVQGKTSTDAVIKQVLTRKKRPRISRQ